MKQPSNLFCIIVLLVLPALWWLPLLGGKLPDFMDTVTQLYPMRAAAAHQFWSATLPLWFPNLGAGYPLAANPQIAVWYPPHWLYFLVPTVAMNGFVMVLHYWIGGLGMWLLCRKTGTSAIAALFGAVGFQFGAMMISRIALTPHLSTMAWVPLILWGVEQSVSAKKPWRGALWVACFFSLQLLAGAPQVSYYTSLLLPCWWLCRGFSYKRKTLMTLRSGVLAATIAALITAIQLIPTLELMNHSTRSSIAVDRLVEQGLNGNVIWQALVGFTGNPIEDTDSINAIGIGLLLIIPFALVGRKRRKLIIPLLILGCCFWVLSIGLLAPLFSKILPLYSGFHAPRRALMIWSALGPLAAAHGAQVLILFLRRRNLQRFAPWILMALLMGNLWMLPRLEREFADVERFNPHSDDPAVLSQDRFLTLDPNFRYAYDSRNANYGRSIMPDLAALHQLYDVQTYDPIVLKRMAMVREIVCARSGSFYPSHGVILTDPNSPLLKMLNVQYLIGRWDLFDPGRLIPGTRIDTKLTGQSVELVRDELYWPLYRYKEIRPLAWFVKSVVPAQDANQALLGASQQNPLEVAFTEEPLQLLRTKQVPQVTTTRSSGSSFQITLETPNTQPQFLCVSSIWMPGWYAETDSGQPLNVIPANGAILGMVVPPSTTSVTVWYFPTSFIQGALLSLVGLILGLVVFLKTGRNAQYPSNT